ncbi:MAG: response regulator transcription factor [Thiovulaceae bacterium]|jgi:DNA-binding response OmpR family regulator|nr:response regulator transcription factor [Sulfurimonadaceae bacterium]
MKILLVEDDAKITSFLTKGLEEEYFCVDATPSGDEAYYLATTRAYDVIILDIMLLEGDGYEVCKKLRAAKVLTPIIILSAKSAIEDKVTFLNIGADDYLTKPFSFDELLARIRVQLRKKEQKDNLLCVDDLILNTDTKTLTRSGTKINLTAKEYAILEYMMRNQGTILDEQTLLENTLKLDADVSSNVINVYIYRLRSKIDKEFEKKLIKTHRNLGFAIGD